MVIYNDKVVITIAAFATGWWQLPPMPIVVSRIIVHERSLYRKRRWEHAARSILLLQKMSITRPRLRMVGTATMRITAPRDAAIRVLQREDGRGRTGRGWRHVGACLEGCEYRRPSLVMMLLLLLLMVVI